MRVEYDKIQPHHPLASVATMLCHEQEADSGGESESE